MWHEQIQKYLTPGGSENDEGFRAEILRLSRVGLQVLGGVEIGVTVLMVIANLLLDPIATALGARLTLLAVLTPLGLATIGVSRLDFLKQQYRKLACLSGVLAMAALTSFFLHMTRLDPSSDDFIPGTMTLILLVTVSAVPLKPVQTLYYGGLIIATYVICALGAWDHANLGSGVEGIYVVFGFTLTLLACALSAVLYNQRRSMWQMHRSMLTAAEQMRQSEARNMLAQNAASVGRLAAALSHELNSPIGALVSAVDTLLLLAARQATSPPEQQQRLVVLQNDLRKSIRESTERLKGIVARMQRFTNLDKAEVQSANINEIISDVIALLEPTFKDRAQVELKLNPVPELICRPQQLSAVFSSLLGNAIDASEADARVCLSTFVHDGHVVTRIQDNGRGLEADQAANIFDPGFRVSAGRVSTGNWSMFSSRQIIREHGGDIDLKSSPGQGTCVDVKLPIPEQALT